MRSCANCSTVQGLIYSTARSEGIKKGAYGLGPFTLFGQADYQEDDGRQKEV